jgi:hypothetical protein
LSLEEKWKWCFLSDDFRDMYVIRIVPSDCAKFFGPESLLTYGAYFVF